MAELNNSEKLDLVWFMEEQNYAISNRMRKLEISLIDDVRLNQNIVLPSAATNEFIANRLRSIFLSYTEYILTVLHDKLNVPNADVILLEVLQSACLKVIGETPISIEDTLEMPGMDKLITECTYVAAKTGIWPCSYIFPTDYKCKLGTEVKECVDPGQEAR